ncbi:unnamed protein product [Dicrocoelium dendriticum]|nr:unnamed protein product [Dicrocoelium dendriticum]
MPVAWKQAQNSRRSSFNNQCLTTRTVQKDGQQGKRSIVHYIKPSKDKHYVPTRLIVVNKGRNRDSTGYIVSPLTILEHDVQRDVELSGEKFSLRIIHIDGDTCSVLQQLAPYLVHVELSDLQLTEVPQGILGRFTTALESLHLDNNKFGDALFNALEGSYRQYHSFRIAKNKNLQLQEVHWLQTLRELSLEYNLICGKLPFNTLRLLSQLQRLYLTGNAISTLQGIDSLHGLRVLGCDYNQLGELHKDVFKLRRLECGYFARNCIIQPVTSAGVLGLVNLRILDISHNGLVTLPGALFKLQVLDSLQASHNKIAVLPNISGGPQLRVRPLSIIDLSNNSVTSIPPAFVKIVNFLDLSYNRIRNVPSAMLKWLSNASQRRGCKPSELFAIDLTGNHIVWPPGEATTDNVDSMVEYYSEKRTEAHAYHGLKVMFFGTSNCGKTSLVTSMSDGQYRYADSSEESTFGIDLFEIPFDTGSVQLTADRPNALGQTASRRINMSVWDCAGLHCYKQLLAYFSASPLIIVVSIDMEQYALMNQFDENLFHNLIGQWVDLILARSLEALILLVGLKSDRIESKEELMMYLSKMHEDAIRYLNDRRGWLYAEIERLENLSYASSSIKQLYEQLNHIYESARIHVYKPAIPVSCCASAGKSNELGWNSLFHGLTDAVLKHPHILPHFLSPLPPIWSDITDYLEDLSSPQNETAPVDMGMPLIEKSQLISQIQAKFHVNRADIIVLFRYLHETGRLFIPQLALTREERAYQEAIESTHRPKPQVIIVTNLSVLMNFLKCVLHPSLTACLSQTSEFSVVDTPFPAGFRLELLSHFPLTNREEANRQLDESIKILQRGTGIVCAELWVTLAKYSSMPLGDKNKQNGKYLLELLWRAMELAFPVAFPEQKEDETAGSVHESFNLSVSLILFISWPLADIGDNYLNYM